MSVNESDFNKVLVITLSNIGDIILTFPVIDILKENFPQANLSIAVGPKGEEFFKGNPCIDQLVIFNKNQSLKKTWQQICLLRKTEFDLVVDLRNTAIPFLLRARRKTSFLLARHKGLHVSQQHLNRLKSVYPFASLAVRCYALHLREEDQQSVREIMDQHGGADQPFVCVGPGAADTAKQWDEQRFAEVCDYLKRQHGLNVFFIGDQRDKALAQRVRSKMKDPAVNLCGQTNLIQLACLFQKASLVIVNDSAPMHLASYLDIPVLALFGPTSPLRYGPWGKNGHSVDRKSHCPKCRSPKTNQGHSCLDKISVEDVVQTLECEIFSRR